MGQICRLFNRHNEKVFHDAKSINKGNSKSFIQDNSDGYDSNPEQIQPIVKPKIRWKKGDLIGQGSFGSVFIGMDSLTGRVLAIKEVQIQKLELQDEIDILSSLQHKNIVEYLGYEKTQEGIYIFLEYVGGGSISQMLKRFGKFSESVIQSYLKQILQGLIYLHKRKVIHRDIKGANILVDAKGVCKLADFGCSIYLMDHKNSLKGTPNWMAPEVIKQTQSGRKSDIWSLGCLVIEMLTAQPPWGVFNTSVAALLYIENQRKTPPIPFDTSHKLKDFLRKCLAWEPQDRWTAQQLSDHPFMQIEFRRHERTSSYLDELYPKQFNQK